MPRKRNFQMKKEILLTPLKASLSLFLDLEKKKLIRLIRPDRKTLETKTKTGAVSRFYTSSRESGTHTLMSVGKRTETVKLSCHDGNEDFLLINPSGLKFKKLYLVISLYKKNALLKKIASQTLSSGDFLAVELKFNDPELSFFIMLKNTVHCELTCGGSGQHPVFFVSEPSNLKNGTIKTKNYNIRLLTEKK